MKYLKGQVKRPKKPVIKLMAALVGPPPTMKNAHNAGMTDNAYPMVALDPVALVANPHKTPDIKDNMTVP